MISFLQPFFERNSRRVLLDGRHKVLYGEIWERAVRRSKEYPVRGPPVMYISAPNSEEWLIRLLSGWHQDAEVVAVSPRRLVSVENIVADSDTEKKHCLSLFTSGSMGNGTRIRFTSKNLITNIQQISAAVPADMIHEDDSSYSVLPWSHCYGLVCELLFLITRGARLYLPENNPQKDMTTFHPSLLFTVPYMLDRVLKSLPLISNKMFWRITSPIFRRHIFGKRMRSLSIGGAACDPAMIDECEKKLGVRIFQGYGMTEASPMIALNTLRHYHPSSVGKILPNIDIQIGSDNEILVSGDNIVSSLPQDRYISRDDGRIYLRTGDCGHVDGNGFLYITGRIHDHFKLPNGLYIHPNAIEQLYHKMYRPSYVLQWAIIPHPHNPSRLMMVGLCEKDASLVKIDMNKIVSIGKESHLKSYEIPIDVVCVMAHDFLTEKYTVRRSPLHQYLIKRISSHIGGPPS